MVLDESKILIPGFIDTHIHAPQIAFTGTGYDLSLLEWLEKYTFPMESKFKNKDFAIQIYPYVVRKTLRNGTTTACYFGTTHTDSTITRHGPMERVMC